VAHAWLKWPQWVLACRPLIGGGFWCCGTAHRRRSAAHWAAKTGSLLVLAVCELAVTLCHADAVPLKYFPAGPIYEYRWKLLELALAHLPADPAGAYKLEPYAEDVSQNRGINLLQSGAIDVVALGTNAEREKQMRPVKIDILRGLVGYRIFIIRADDQERIARMSDAAFRQQLTFGLNSQWADLPIMQANGYTMLTSTDYEGLFGMLAARRFDAIPRGLNEAGVELAARLQTYPQLSIERTRALYIPYPVYFWVARDRVALANRIERGLRAALADGSFRKLFEAYHADALADLAKQNRRVIRLSNPVLPPGSVEPDTSWWWR